MRILVIYIITLVIMFVIINIATNFLFRKKEKIKDFYEKEYKFFEKEKSDNSCIKKIN
jgi:hypothetical protein